MKFRKIAIGTLLAVLLISLPLAAQDPRADSFDPDHRFRVFDVQDLTCLGDQAESPGEMHEVKLKELMKQAAEQTEALARIIRTFLIPSLKTGEESLSAPRPGFLLFEGRAAQEQWIRTFVETQRRERDVCFMIELKIYSLTEQAYRLWKPITGASHARVVSPKEAAEILDRLHLGKGVDLLQAPRICTVNRQMATMSVSTEIPYVKEYKVYEQVAPSNRRIVAPIVDTVENGLYYDILSALLDTDKIALDFKIASKRVEKPIPSEWTEHGEIAKPVMNTLVVESKAVLSSGATLIFVSSAHEDRYQVQFLTVTRLTEEELSILSGEEEK